MFGLGKKKDVATAAETPEPVFVQESPQTQTEQTQPEIDADEALVAARRVCFSPPTPLSAGGLNDDDGDGDMSLGTLSLDAQNLSGEIKRADAAVVEAGVMRKRAESALELAQEAERRAIQDAASVRERRTLMAARAAEEIMALGEVRVDPEPVNTAPISASSTDMFYGGAPGGGMGEVVDAEARV